MEDKILKLFLIDNLFFNRIENTNELLDNLLSSFNAQNVSALVENSEIIYVNNSNKSWDDKFIQREIKIVNSIAEIDLLKYDTVLYCNTPFFSVATVFNDIVTNKDLAKNTILTQLGYNLSPILKNNNTRFLFVKGKPHQECNITALNMFAFKPANIAPDFNYRFESQKNLVQFLHHKNPIITLNYYNVAGISPFSFFDTEEEYITFCFPDTTLVDKGTVGTYIVNFSNDISLDTIKNFVMELLDNNKKIVIDIRTPHNISGIFEESIEEVDGEFIVKNAFEGDVSRIITTNKDLMHYDFNVVNGVIDLSDRHIRHLMMGTPKYMKIYNSEYKPLYKIGKNDLQSAKKIAVKRTMGMGDALLTMPIISLIKTNFPHIEIDFYSMYDFRPHLKYPSYISNFHQLDGTGIFNHVDGDYDLVLDFDLSYENQTNGERFYDYYMSLFDDKTFDKDLEDKLILNNNTLMEEGDKGCTIVAEGSGWGGKEPNIDIMERLAYEMKKKGFKVFEPGINRITHYVDETNPEQNVSKMFQMVANSDCYIGTDSGISHIANMMGKPCFIIGGSADPMKTQYNLSLVYPVGRTDLLCYGCRHFTKGFRTLESGVNTFVSSCHNDKQYECMKTLDSDIIIEELNNFLIKYDLI